MFLLFLSYLIRCIVQRVPTALITRQMKYIFCGSNYKIYSIYPSFSFFSFSLSWISPFFLYKLLSTATAPITLLSFPLNFSMTYDCAQEDNRTWCNLCHVISPRDYPKCCHSHPSPLSISLYLPLSHFLLTTLCYHWWWWSATLLLSSSSAIYLFVAISQSLPAHNFKLRVKLLLPPTTYQPVLPNRLIAVLIS